MVGGVVAGLAARIAAETAAAARARPAAPGFRGAASVAPRLLVKSEVRAWGVVVQHTHLVPQTLNPKNPKP